MKKKRYKRNRRRSRIPIQIRIPFLLLAILAVVFLGSDGLEEISLPKAGKAILEEAKILVGDVQNITGEFMGKFAPKAKLKRERIGAGQTDEGLTVWFLDVGQGSAALLQTGNHFMLIDGGDRETSSKVVSFLQDQGVRGLDYLIVSHYDSDHLAGVVGALNVFPVDQVLSPDYEAETKLFASYSAVLKEKHIPEAHPSVGEKFSFGEGSFTLVGPAYYGHGDENDDSLCVRLEFGGKSFLFCGDAGEEAEEEMEKGNQKLKSDVYVVNHHGSASSTSEDFFERVDPEYAVISCGADNSYGHPAARVMNLLKKSEVELFRTDTQGAIQAVVQEGELSFQMPASDDFSSRSRG